MKLFRRLSALVMALVLVLSLSIGVLAADFDNMYDGFNYDGEDTEVNINLKADDDYGYYEAKEGKTYNISSDNDSALVSSTFAGSGTVNIDSAAVEGSLYVVEQVDVTTNGDIEAMLYTYDQSNLTVNGNVDGSVTAMDSSEITVNGDVNGRDGNPDDVDFSDPLSASYGSSGVTAYANSTITVNGDVTGGDGYGTCASGGDGVEAWGTSTVTISGNVTGGDVIADPNTEVYEEDGWTDESHAGNGVYITRIPTVTIGGNVTGGSTNGDCGFAGTGVAAYPGYPSDTTIYTVTVGGAVTAGTAENGTDGVDLSINLMEGTPLPNVTVGAYNTVEGHMLTDLFDEAYGVGHVLTQEDLIPLITVTGIPDSSESDYGTSFYYSRGRLINEHGVSVRALFAFGDDWEETVENGTVTITSAEKKGEIVVTVESLKVMMDVGIETILFNGTKLVLKDAVAERSAYDTYTITASAILLNGAAV